ncbi:MAG: L-threonylcarbamoyladenylate synthase [Acidobacteriota bacterium]|nr:L-threonylcarbamoyladenylate synthase [Acidobacteriota bacterium]
MKTVLTKSTVEAASFIKAGGIAAFPTETVYGLGAGVFDEEAIEKVFEAKGRPADNPLIVHVSNEEQIPLIVAVVTPTARILIDRFFPGPLTIVLEKAPLVPASVTGGLDTVAIRMPDHELARALIDLTGPLVAPSANLSGRPSPTTWEAVREDLDGRIDCILQGETTMFGIESTVVDCTFEAPQVLRTGAVSLEQLREVESSVKLFESPESSEVRSPGLKHKHYSPSAEVKIFDNTTNLERTVSAAYIGLTKPLGEYQRVLICDSAEHYARSLFEFFRECDRNGISNIYCEQVKETGIGLALMDRIRRAARR